MNKLPFLIGTFIIALAIQSCSKSTCYECTLNSGGVNTVQNFCDGDTVANIKVNNIPATVPIKGVTAALYSEGLIKAGYSCK
jgi:hypothetical protein